jgi:hypothetical protein
MSTLRVNTIQDSTGSSSPAINGLAKAWVNFNGTGTVAIRASLNVSSITDNGTGDYTVNFGTAMSDANYAYTVDGREDENNNSNWAALPVPFRTAQTSTTFRISCKVPNGGSAYDYNSVTLVAFR